MMTASIALLRKAAVALLGGLVLLVGLAMIVLPGPAFLVIPAALAILAMEFAWAGRLLGALRKRLERKRVSPIK